MSEESNASAAIRAKLRELRDNNAIDFTNKDNYPIILKQLAKDFKVDYAQVYRCMQKVAKEAPLAKSLEKTTSSTKKVESTFRVKPVKATQYQENLEKQITEIKTDFQTRNTILQSEEFKMLKETYAQSFLMIRDFFQMLQIPVAKEEQYIAVGQMTALKSLKGQESLAWFFDKLENSIYYFSMGALFVTPIVAKLLELKSSDKEIKSKQPLAPLDNGERHESSSSNKSTATS